MGNGNALRVHWQVTASEPPRIWRHCGHCGSKRPFRSSGMFRCNAQKKRLDVWLIYRCAACGRTWNYPLFERCPLGEIPPPLFQAITGNCAETARGYACDAARLRAFVDRVEPSGAVAVAKTILDGAAATADRLDIQIAVSAPSDLRLERLLARELGLSRNLVRTLRDTRALTVATGGKAAFRQAARDGQSVTLDLRALPVGDPVATLLKRATRDSGPG